MIWTILSFAIIMILVLGMILAAKLGNKAVPGAGTLGNCRRGAVPIPKGPR